MHAADPLSDLLRRADPAAPGAPAPVAFAAAVHARIRSADTEAAWHPAGGPRGVSSALARHLLPLAAALAVLASILAGGSAALAAHRRENTEHFAAAYARSVDPVLMHATHSASAHAR